MIKNVTSGASGYVIVSGGHTPYVNINNMPSAGTLRFNGGTQQLEAYDGYTWVPMHSSDAYVDLSGPAKETLDWARKQMEEEKRLKARAETDPTMKSLLDELNSVKEKIKMVEILTKDEVKV